MQDSATTASADDEVAQFLHDSGVLRAMQQDTLDVNLRCVANSQGLEVLHISHWHHPAVEMALYLGDVEDHRMSRGEQRRTVCEQTRTSVRAKANTSSPAGLEEA